MAKSMWPTIGAAAFVVGLVIAVLAGFFSPANASVVLVLGILGLIVGLLNVGDKEVVLFLLAALTFMTAAYSLSSVITSVLVGFGGSEIVAVLQYIVAFVGPGAAVVALKAIYDVAREV